jgi:hypothetical protein
MSDINSALAASGDAVEQLIAAGERSGSAWSAPRAPGKWSPSQIVEHVARSLEESANIAEGRPTKFPTLPGFIRPLVRRFGLVRIVRTGKFPRGRTTRSMNPASGPATATEGRRRLEGAHQAFDRACRRIAAGDGLIASPIFGSVPIADYVRFMELHTRHHRKQMPDQKSTPDVVLPR